MNTELPAKAAQPAAAILYVANTWAFNFILFGLLVDIMFRAIVFHEAAWDLFALIGMSGAISAAYLARQKVLGQVLGWKSVIVMAIVALIAAVVAAIIAMTKTI